jgi:hypothetical protein
MSYPVLRPTAGAPEHFRPDAPPQLADAAREFVSIARWTFASSMPQYPHHHVTREAAERGSAAAGYDALRELIVSHHYLREWNGRSFRGVTVGGLTLWIMQTDLIVINAKPAERDDWEQSVPSLFDFLP